MVAYLYKFGKRRNSTVRPNTETPMKQIEVVLKDTTSILYPTVSMITDMSEYNYIHMPYMGNRFYFITDWTYDIGRWWASCEIDVLATYRNSVFNFSGYCLRSSSQPVNKIVDELAPKLADTNTIQVPFNSPWIANLNAGIYICGIVNDDVNSLGSVSYYSLTQPQLNALKNYLMENPNYVTTDFSTLGISQDLLKALFNPLQYIVSCMFFPIAGLGGDSAEVTNLHCGWYTTPVSGRQIVPTAYGNSILNLPIPKHPQSIVNANMAYLRCSAYSKYILHFPPFQDIVLDSELLLDVEGKEVNAIDLQLLIDPPTGIGSLKVTPHDSTFVLAYTETQIGVPLALAQMSTDLSNLKMAAGATLISQAANWLTKSSALSFLGNYQETGNAIVSGIGEIASAGSTKLLSSGSNGSLASFFNCTPQLQAIFTYVQPVDSNMMGYPTCATKQLGSLDGFAMMYRPAITLPAPGTITEAELINNMLATGIYCEWND